MLVIGYRVLWMRSQAGQQQRSAGCRRAASGRRVVGRAAAWVESPLGELANAVIGEHERGGCGRVVDVRAVSDAARAQEPGDGKVEDLGRTRFLVDLKSYAQLGLGQATGERLEGDQDPGGEMRQLGRGGGHGLFRVAEPHGRDGLGARESTAKVTET